jgi:predicted transglutaminase-like cysteine proteinase
MVLISLTPLSFRKLLFFGAIALGISCASCFAAPLLLSVKSTPYDNQMNRIRPILQTTAKSQRDVSLNVVNHWMEDLRTIPYGFSQEWKTPSEVGTAPAADCKGKAVALYERMQASGASNVRLVIGKRTSGSRLTHAWLLWETSNGTYVLDPTINWTACREEQAGNRSYIPFYAFAGNRKYRAATATLLARN